MKNQKVTLFVLGLIGLFFINTKLIAQNPNFYIYLCFGQSNMQGQGAIQNQDKVVDARFKTFQALDCSNLARTKEKWYTAVPPTCQCYSLLSPADYFGRTMVANLPDSITIGIINVAIAGCDIRLFDKDIYQKYDSTYTDSWFTNLVKQYDWNPYQYLINLAKKAQNDGVIKGILLHQGETNTGDVKWPSYVKKIYNDMLNDLSLSADSVPLLAGEVLSESGNCCSSMNTIINRLHDTIPTAYVVSSRGCTGQDAAHFNSEGYRKFGRRYGVKMLSLLGYESVYTEAECSTVGKNLYTLSDKSASNTAYIQSVGNFTVPSSDDAVLVNLKFSVKADTNYYIYGRFNNSVAGHNSFWLKIDDGDYELYSNMTTSGWEWLEMKDIALLKGEHTLRFAFANDSIKFDKLVVKNSPIKPVDVGEEATSLCNAVITGNIEQRIEGYSLGQVYPNPATNLNVSFTFNIPNTAFVSLKIVNSLGMPIEELAGKEFYAGKHLIDYKIDKLSPGIYFYTLQTDNYMETRKMIVISK